MDLIIGFILRNLVTQTNFVKFRDSQIFKIFGALYAEQKKKKKKKKGFLRNISKIENKLRKFHLK